jgi:aspartyl-tRNA(Asn)/glutamyl-tRNA(Gln) amidotransferase subunit A
MELHEMTVCRLKEMIGAKEVSCTEVLDSFIARVRAVDEQTEGYITNTFDMAKEKAEAQDKALANGEDIGPLGGIPYALKDNICTKDILTTCSSQLLKNFVPPYNAYVYDRLEQAGALLLGKVDMDEFAMGSTCENSTFGRVKNPYNTDCVPGGSSGGCAATVSAGESAFALGSDTGGSVRNPAAFCGITGFKPTYGTVSRYGLIAFASSLDQIGPLTKDVADCAKIMNAISGYDKRDSTSIDRPAFDYESFLTEGIKDMKIGVDRSALAKGVDADVLATYEETIKTFESLGATIVDVNFSLLEYAVPVYYLVACSEASSNLARFDGIRYGVREAGSDVEEIIVNSRSEGFGEEVKRRIMLGTYALSAGYYDMYYNKALKVRRLIKEDVYRMFESCDAYLCPTTPMLAYKRGETVDDHMTLYLSDIFTVTANLAGVPAMSVPAGFSKNGLPIGMQLYAKGLGEEQLFRAAYNFQLATDWHKRRPQL